MLTGAVLVDLRTVRRESMRRRLFALSSAPDGAKVVVIVGPLAPEPIAVDCLRAHRDRLRIEVCGEPETVPRWIKAIAADGLVMAS